MNKGPDIVLVGDGGVTIATGFGSYADSADNATIEVTLTEDRFYHVPEDVDDIRSISPTLFKKIEFER